MKYLFAALFFVSSAFGASVNPSPDTTTIFANPERGWHFQAGSLLNSASVSSNLDFVVNGTTGLTNERATLMVVPTDLPSTNLSGGQLSEINASFAVFRTKGAKAIPRFRYSTEPGIAQVEAHAAQIKPYLYANRDVIAYVQAGFIAAYGEWAGSAAGLDTKANKRRVKDAVLDMVPPEIPVQFTQVYPAMEDWFVGKSALASTDAFTGSPQARMGFHSDCFLTGNGDSSFYPGSQTIVDFTTAASEAQKRAYVATATEHAPFGGETCNNSTGAAAQMRTACSGSTDGIGQSGGILAEGPRYHLTYLNRGFATNFHDAWVAGNCYNTVARMMGYRIQYDSITHADVVALGSSLVVTVALRNYGWSRVHRERHLSGRLVKSGSPDIPCASAQDLRKLPSQATSSTKQQLKCVVPWNQPTGSYALRISMPDVNPSLSTVRAYKARNANGAPGSWDDTSGEWVTSTTVAVQ